MANEQAPESQATPSGEVFISYASQDAAVANSLVEALDAGFRLIGPTRFRQLGTT